MGSTNFLIWDPNCNNQESDAAYLGDSQRVGGAVDPSPFLSVLANKLFYQQSIAIAALMGMLAAKGYSPNDGSANPATALANLEAVLANIVTQVDLPKLVQRISSINNSTSANGQTLVSYTVPAGVLKAGSALDLTVCGLCSSGVFMDPVIGGTPFGYSGNNSFRILIQLTSLTQYSAVGHENTFNNVTPILAPTVTCPNISTNPFSVAVLQIASGTIQDGNMNLLIYP